MSEAEQALVRLARADAEWKRTRKARAETFRLGHDWLTGEWYSDDHLHANAYAFDAFARASIEHRTALNAVLRLGRKLGGQ